MEFIVKAKHMDFAKIIVGVRTIITKIIVGVTKIIVEVRTTSKYLPSIIRIHYYYLID